jgi:hypothetical protein
VYDYFFRKSAPYNFLNSMNKDENIIIKSSKRSALNTYNYIFANKVKGIVSRDGVSTEATDV